MKLHRKGAQPPERKGPLLKKRSLKAGLPPGTPVHIGERIPREATVKVMDYDEAGVRELEVRELKECFLFRDKPTATWIDIEGIHDLGILEGIGECYGIHPLTIEDIMNTDQRPKVEDYGEYLFIVLKMLRENGGGIVSEQVSIVLGKNFLFSFQEGIKGDVFDPIRERIRQGKGRIRASASDYLAYSMIDSLVDNYFVILEGIGEEIEAIEEELVTSPTPETLRKIHALKREMIFLRKAVWPLREVISRMERRESPLLTEPTALYLRDLYDHAVQVIDTIETFREMLSGMLDIYLSSISNRMNSVMKTLTFIATIFMPLTFIAGIYGMNFRHMPELEWRWGYPASLGVMIAVGILMVIYFKKKKWLE